MKVIDQEKNKKELDFRLWLEWYRNRIKDKGVGFDEWKEDRYKEIFRKDIVDDLNK